MSRIEESVATLEASIKTLIEQLELLKSKNKELTEALKNSEEQVLEYKNKLVTCNQQYESVMLANSLLGSNDYNKQTKLKINTLIREIDYCISQLSK